MRSEMFTRRTATVTISAPEASCACTITAGDEYLPVPTISRDEKVLSAIVKDPRCCSSASIRPITVAIAAASSSTSRRPTKFTISTASPSRTTVSVERGAFEHDEVVLDGHAARVDLELRQKFGDASAGRRSRRDRRSG